MRRVVGWGGAVVWAVWAVLGCTQVPAEGGACAPERGWDCAVGEACVSGQCVESPGAEACTVGAKRACEEGCAGVRTCGAEGRWGACETCGEGQRCEGTRCVCDATSCARGCCQGDTCVPGTAPTACGKGGAACEHCPGACDGERGVCGGCLEDAQCGGAAPRCDARTGTCVCVKSEPAERQCSDGQDNDCDGLADCADPDCGTRACGAHGEVCGGTACVCPGGSTELACGDGQDNDCDGLIDCADPDCNTRACSGTGKVCGSAACACPGGSTEGVCGDGQDNDCDGLIDCADPDCNARSCRAAVGVCDAEEVCGAGVCPADKRIGTDVICRPTRGGCDVEERCDGTASACPADRKVAAGTVCRASAGGCDPAESCDGSAPACPADSYLASGAVCRPAAGACDVAEKCSGSSPQCPTNAVDHGRCDDGKACTIDTCETSGVCRHIPTGPGC